VLNNIKVKKALRA